MSGLRSAPPRGTSGVLGAAPLLYLSARGGAGLLKRRWRLVAVEGPDQGQRAELTTWTALVGAAPAAALVLTDDAASRYHAELDLFAEGVRVRDLESTNGTLVEGQPIRQAFLFPGETFRVGETTLRVDAIDEPLPEPEVDAGSPEQLQGLVGADPVTRRLFARVRRVAQVRSTVLLVGPRGAGKSALARALHAESRRRNGPFVEVDLRAPPDLSPAFERARGGTLFLDRVESIPRGRQADLLERLGHLPVGGRDLRVVASTTRPLERPLPIDPRLAARLSVIVLEVPRLADRKADIVPIARRFFEAQTGGALELGPRVLEALERYDWPGHVAGLERTLARLRVPTAHDDGAWMASLRRTFLDELLRAHAGHVTAASHALGVPQRALFSALAAHDVDID